MSEMIYSFSRLTTFLQCPQAFKLQYIDKVPQEEDTSWALLGGYGHDTIEKVLLGELAQEEAATYYTKNLPEYNFATMKPEYGDNFVADCVRFFENFKGVDGEIVSVEEKFIIDIGGAKLQGFIDLITQDSGYHIIDWKFGSQSSFTGKKFAVKKHQLYLYAAAMKEKYGEYPKDMQFRFTRFDKVKTEKFSMKEMQKTIDWVKETVEAIEDEWRYDEKEDFFFCRNLCGFSQCKFNGNYNK